MFIFADGSNIRAADGDFKYDPKFNYMYLPSKRVAYENDSTGGQDGSLYMEVISYSEILKRAERRNEAFTSKLFPPKNEEKEEGVIEEDKTKTEEVEDSLFNNQ